MNFMLFYDSTVNQDIQYPYNAVIMQVPSLPLMAGSVAMWTTVVGQKQILSIYYQILKPPNEV